MEELRFPLLEKKESQENDFFKEEGEEAREQVVGSSQVGVSFHHLTNGLLPRLVSAHSPPLTPSLPQLPPTHFKISITLFCALLVDFAPQAAVHAARRPSCGTACGSVVSMRVRVVVVLGE